MTWGAECSIPWRTDCYYKGQRSPLQLIQPEHYLSSQFCRNVRYMGSFAFYYSSHC